MVVCQMCGDTGWLGALIFCSLCQRIAGHIYCLDQSKTTTEDEEIRWVCEFCEPSIIELSDSTDQSSEPQPFQSLARPRSTLDSKESLYTRTKEMQTLSLCNDRRNNHDKGKCIVEDVQFSGKYSTDNSQESSPSSEEIRDTIEPLPDYIWRGRFCVYGKYSCTILAHMSNEEACTEASEVISSLPTLLGLEIVPKINIWPLKLRNMVPTADTISVYFFPEDYSAERVYDRLVDYMIENEVAMITKVHDVELLVFSSRELHMNDWRYQRKYYLWGILRRKKKLLPQNQSDNHTSSHHGNISYTWPSGSTAEIGAKDSQDFEILS
ncbi:PHD finger-containing protein 6-like [Silene latifolia]|uniref:PHD finger-containing protein 6-like n=1 Tax=Silene latifolia TaxID=37657 RepID=UPI003D782168